MVEEYIRATALTLLFLPLELGWILTVGFEVQAEKTYFRLRKLKNLPDIQGHYPMIYNL